MSHDTLQSDVRQHGVVVIVDVVDVVVINDIADVVVIVVVVSENVLFVIVLELPTETARPSCTFALS